METKLKEKITSSLNTKSRHLTLLGKVTLINTLILSKLWYTTTCTIISDPFSDGWMESFLASSGRQRKRWPDPHSFYREKMEASASTILKWDVERFGYKAPLFVYISSHAVWSPIATYWCALPLYRFNRTKRANMQPHSSEATGFYGVAIPDTKKFFPLIENPDIKTFTKRCYKLILSS